MTINGWVQIALYCVLVTLFVKPFGVFMAPRLRGRAHVPSPGAAAGRARGLLVLRRRREAGAALADLCRRDAVLQRRRLRDALRAAALPGHPAVQPAGPVGGRAEPRLQHGGELRHQHQLAGLWRRDDHELPDADGGAHGAQFRLGRDRHRARASRSSAASRGVRAQDDRQFLGRSHPLHALHPAAALDRRRRSC